MLLSSKRLPIYAALLFVVLAAGGGRIYYVQAAKSFFPASMNMAAIGVAGVTQDAVMAGEHFTYEFIARHPGTYWYHSHQMSSEQSKRGLIGRIVIEPKQPSIRTDRDYAVTLQKLNANTPLTNGQTGTLQFEADPGETVRLRIVNSANETQDLLVAGVKFQVVTLDGQDLNDPEPIEKRRLQIGAGQRCDLLFRMPAEGSAAVASTDKTYYIKLGSGKLLGSLSPAGTSLFDIASYGSPKDDGMTLESKFDRSYEQVLRSSYGFFNGRFGQKYTINGEAFHENPPLMVGEGDRVKIRLSNRGGGDHPVHLHGHTFKVLSKNDSPLTGSPIYLDTILVRPGESYEIAFIADNPGLWMEHCHNLEHAALGMSMMVNYEGITTPYRVGVAAGNLPD
jgi:FtsP/CotA-like multicopper oxidase with cupredoxin domain